MTEASVTARNIRKALRQLPQTAAQESLQPPPPAQLYVPESHTKALGLDTTLVAGMRGAGKSVWTSALFNGDTRQLLIRAGASRVLGRTQVRIGYGVDPYGGHHPSPAVLQKLLRDGLEPRHIWRGVLARHVSDAAGLDRVRAQSWEQAARWAGEEPEGFDRLLADCSHALKASERYFLLVFDALDTLPGQWDTVRPLARGALELALSCRALKNIRLKFFIRPDMKDDPTIFDFRDSSKLLHDHLELTWRPIDLYGLVTHLLANGSAGADFRARTAQACGVHWDKANGIYDVPGLLRRDEQAQRHLVQLVAGRWMGRDRRRGITYTWIPTHLADAHGRVAPRSLLLALRKAAEITEDRFADHPSALHYEAIKEGVAKASETRVHEISREDYPWVEPLLRALRGMAVPCDRQDLEYRWAEAVFQEMMAASENKLPPRRYSSPPSGTRSIDLLIDDLDELGVVYRTADGRINIPDIFRVGFDIKRKGGVRPPGRADR